MLIIPAIDIKDGQVVRLTQGSFKEKKVYSNDPVKTAQHWVSQGAQILHVVDLDGACLGVPKNFLSIKKLIEAADVPVQIGGGIRSLELIRKALNFGAYRVVLGTRAAKDLDFLQKAYKEFKNKIIVSIDARDGLVSVDGWKRSLKGMNAFKFATVLKDMGLRQLIYTDISKDGMLKGPNIQGIKSLLKAAGIEVIASGGISTLEDIRKLRALEGQGVMGAIVGKALYEGKFTLQQALKLSQ